jgi:hypothetical protein
MRRIFPKAEDNFTGIMQDEQLALMQEKFDKCMRMVLCFASLGASNPSINPADCELNLFDSFNLSPF